MLVKMDRTPFAPKAGALPGCATPRTAEALRFLAGKGQAQSGVRGISRRNGARTGHLNPGIVPEDVHKAFYANRPATVVEHRAGLTETIIGGSHGY